MLRRHLVRRQLRAALVAAVILGAAATGCTGEDTEALSSSGEGGAEPAPIDEAALAEEIAAEFRGDQPSRSALEASRCFAAELLERTGPEELRSAGLVGEDGHLVEPLPELSRDLATTWVAAQQECRDFIASSTEALAAQSKGKLDRERYTDCLERQLTEEEIRAGLVAAISGDLQGEAVAVISDAQAQCAQRALPQG